MSNVYKFIEKHGIDRSREVLENAPHWARYYSNIDGEYYLIELNAVFLPKLEQAITDFNLVIEHRLPDGFWSEKSIDIFGIEGTSMYLEAYAFYSNDHEKAVLDRLQLALDRILQSLKGDDQ